MGRAARSMETNVWEDSLPNSPSSLFAIECRVSPSVIVQEKPLDYSIRFVGFSVSSTM